MKSMMLGAFAISALIAAPLGLAGVANAADLLVKAPPPVGCAGNFNIVRANNQIAVDYTAHYLDYLEYAFFTPPPVGSPLDWEKGWQSGIDIFSSAMGNIGPFCNLYVYSEGSYISGKATYGAFGGLTSPANEKFWNEDVRVGEGFNLTQTIMLTPFIGGGFRHWNRFPTIGYVEDYYNGYAGGGMLLQVDATPRSCCPTCCGSSTAVVLAAYGLLGYTIDPYMQTSGPGAAVPLQTFPLGNAPLVKAGASIDYRFTEHLHANAGLDWTYFNFGVSPLNPVLGAVEPNSRTSELLVKAGLGFGW